MRSPAGPAPCRMGAGVACVMAVVLAWPIPTRAYADTGNPAMFRASVNATLDRYRKLIEEVERRTVNLPNDNFDLREISGPGKYPLNDDARAKLLERLAEQMFTGTPVDLRADLLEFDSDLNAAFATKREAKAWARLQTELAQLKKAGTSEVRATSVANTGQHLAAKGLLVKIAP